MEDENINPNKKLEEYEVELNTSKNIFQKIIDGFKKDIKFFPLNNNQNYRLTNRSVESLWRVGEAKAHIVSFFESLHTMIFFKEKRDINQSNIEMQIIKENNIIENISTATKKIGIINPIIPKESGEIKTK